MYLYKKKNALSRRKSEKDATAILQNILTLIITLIIRCIEIVLLLLIYVCFTKIMFVQSTLLKVLFQYLRYTDHCRLTVTKDLC